MGNDSAPVLLVAEDDHDDRLFLREALEEGPHAARLFFVADGEELFAYLYRKGPYADAAAYPEPDLIVLDLNMPKKDGRETLREIKADPKLSAIPVVVVTTSCESEDKDLARELMAAEFLAKPMSFEGWINVAAALAEAARPKAP
ncbi:MAG: response regulator [Deltaproteobacteria bacterium]|nr:response regulator [Deltaproteobacteria bacterium]